MRPHCFLFAAFLLRFAVCARGTEVSGELIDRVWSGHPVSFGLLVAQEHTFIAYYDDQRRLTVLGRGNAEKSWSRFQPPGVASAHGHASNELGWDSHNYLTLALDRDGNLHLAGNMHVDPLVYYRSAQPFDVTTLQRIDHMVGTREARCTYPVFFMDGDGALFFRYRDGGSGNGADLYNIYAEKTRTWRRVLDTALLDGEGHRNAYALDPKLGPDGFFHLVWMWRESPDCSTNNTLSYARSRDFIHWETSQGKPLALPITRATGEVIDPALSHRGLINMSFNLGFDAKKNPVVVYHRYDDHDHSQIFAAHPQGGAWLTNILSAWNFKWEFSGNGSIPAEVSIGPPFIVDEKNMRVDIAAVKLGSFRWIFSSDLLARTGELPAPPNLLPPELLRPRDPSSGFEVQTVVSRSGGRRYVLRWETLPRNRDEPRSSIPIPSELRLFVFPDTDVFSAGRIGS